MHKFRTERRQYVYDVNTSRILRTSPVVWDIVEDHGRLSVAEVQSKFAGRHEPRDIAAALAHIDTAQQEKGLLLPLRPTRIEAPYDSEEIGSRLATSRGQLILNVTEDCNFRCSYCVFGGRYPNHRTHSARYMPLHVAHAAVDDHLAHSGDVTQPVVSFYGGEPLLAVAIIRDVVEYVRKLAGAKRVLFSLTTNGSLLTGDTANFLAREEFSIVVSLDGPRYIHDRHRRTRSAGPTWALVMENIQTFLARHPHYRSNGKMGFSAVVAPGTDLREMREFFDDCGLFTNEMHLNVTTPIEMGDLQVRDSSATDTVRSDVRNLTQSLVLDTRSDIGGTTDTIPPACVCVAAPTPGVPPLFNVPARRATGVCYDRWRLLSLRADAPGRKLQDRRCVAWA
ncbi:MAG: radical SAM protein [Planctomycetota bacterium]|nr:radical SAM protein [Planctomycetota bacterium]